MGYQVIDPEYLRPMPNRPSTAREISNHYTPAADLDEDRKAEQSPPEDEKPSEGGPKNVGMRLYDADPGEQLPNRYHYHAEQEEIFYVVAGELHVETPEHEYVVSEGQVFVVEPGSPHRGFVPASAENGVRVLSIGAPSYGVMGRNDGHAYDPESGES
ncbi:MAG: cupin domain-containing protein [Halobacteriota archaeon]